jgi:Zn-dependent protease/CBS domain-containing protein
MPLQYPGLTALEYWIMGGIGTAILFISILLHELAHSIIARRYGLKVRQIVLFIFGGVSDIEEEEHITTDFRKEFKIAVVGPATSFVLSAIFASAWWVIFLFQGNSGSSSSIAGLGSNVIITVVEGVLFYGAIVNLLIGIFNLIPAFPLDGGRILRAGLVKRKKDYDRATKVSVKIGIWISYGFMGFGFISMLGGSLAGGLWLILIGWFLNNAAQSYLYDRELSSVLSGVRLQDIMNIRVIFVREGTKADELLKDYFNRYMKSAFPVLSAQGDILLGMVTLKEVQDVPEDKKHDISVEEIMIPRDSLIVMESNRMADEALAQMTRRHMGKVFVTDKGGKKLLGLISKTDIMNVAAERREYVGSIKR